MLFTSTYSEWKEYFQDITNRQLLKEYKQLQQLLIDIAPYCKKPGDWYHGESAFLQRLDAERGIYQATKELEKRGYRLNPTSTGVMIKKVNSPNLQIL